MKDSTALWEAWKLAQAYRQKPSEIYAIRDELTAWCFDRAVWMYGTELEHQLREAADGAKNDRQAKLRQSRVLADWGLGEMKFRDPAVGSAAPKKDSAGPSAQDTVTSETAGSVKL